MSQAKNELEKKTIQNAHVGFSLPAVELVGIFFASVVKAQTQFGIHPDSEVIVHHIDGRVVFRVGVRSAARRRDRIVDADLRVGFVRAEVDGPAIEPHLVRIDHILEQIEGIVTAGISAAPSQHSCQIVAGAERNDGTRRLLTHRILTDIVQTL